VEWKISVCIVMQVYIYLRIKLLPLFSCIVVAIIIVVVVVVERHEQIKL